MKIDKIVLLVGPSGVGKSKIKSEILIVPDFNLKESISVTTRLKRDNEKDGKEYIFLDKDKFKKLIIEDEFIEWTKYLDNYYGTLKSQIESIWELNKTPFLEIEIEGVQNILKIYSDKKIIVLFILPPSIKDLKKRLKNRSTENKKEIKSRIKRAKNEIKIFKKIHYIKGKNNISKYWILNKEINLTVEEVNKILQGELINED